MKSYFPFLYCTRFNCFCHRQFVIKIKLICVTGNKDNMNKNILKATKGRLHFNKCDCNLLVGICLELQMVI